MLLGLKRRLVMLSSPQPEWAEKATETILVLKELLGDRAIDIQHVGSTAIQNIKVKPVLDIAVGVESIDGLDDIFPKLELMGIFKSSTQPLPRVILCAMKETMESEIVLSNLHIEVMGSSQWKDHVNFRDYMNTFPEKAVAYKQIKCQLAEQFPYDRDAYLQGKIPFIKECIFEANIFTELCEKLNIVTFESIKKGWSSDKKYYVKTVESSSFLMRVADISQYEQKKAEYENMKRIANLGIPMQQPVDFGVCNGGSNVFLILTWVDGEDAEEVLPLLPETAQYVLGRTAGKILKEMQTTEVSTPSDDWFNGYGIKVERLLWG